MKYKISIDNVVVVEAENEEEALEKAHIKIVESPEYSISVEDE